MAIRNVRIQVFLDLELYQKLLLFVQERGYHIKTDSELVRMSLTNLLKSEDFYKINQYRLQKIIERNKEETIKQQSVIDLLQATVRNKQKDKEIKAINKKARRGKK